MNRTIIIDVTADDIKLGTRGWCRTCPVAMAAERAIGVLVWVNYFNISSGPALWNDVVPDWSIPLPDSAIEFIHQFDRSVIPPKPFSFEISIPEEYARTA